MSTRVEFRWPDELVAAIDAARGSEPRSAFVRRHIEPRVAVRVKQPIEMIQEPDGLERLETREQRIEDERERFDPSDAL